MEVVKNGSFSSEDEEEENSASLESAGSDAAYVDASDPDSGLGSDEFDVTEFGESGMELCQVGNQIFSFPLELFDVPELGAILSLKSWNCCLTEQERVALAEYLPDMDQESFQLTLNELFSGSNFHFWNPLEVFFNQLKGGLCNPSVVLRRRGLNMFQRRQHYHRMRGYHNSMVESLVQIKHDWEECSGLGIEARLRVLNILRIQRRLNSGRNGDLDYETDSEGGNYFPHSPKKASFAVMDLEPTRYRKEKAKGILKVAASMVSAKKGYMKQPGIDLYASRGFGPDINYSEKQGHGSSLHGDWFAIRQAKSASAGWLKSVKSSKPSKSYKNVSHQSRSTRDRTPESEPHSRKVEEKCMSNCKSYVHVRKPKRKSQVRHVNEELPASSRLSGSLDRRKPRRTADFDHLLQQSNDNGNNIGGELDDAVYALENMNTMECNSFRKKRKGKCDDGFLRERDKQMHQQSSSRELIEDHSTTRKKGKRKDNAVVVSSSVVSSEPNIIESGVKELEMDIKIKRKPFILITPTIHTGFSFSIIHLLAAVRKALITPHIEDASDIGSNLEKDDGRMISHSHDLHGDNLQHGSKRSFPSLTFQEITNRVRSNPGDPSILETAEPLQDLVRGVLKIFSSKIAPLGAKGWKPLALYDKINRNWSWVGPVPSISSDNENAEEETSAEAWDIPHKMLVKLVDAFANWLKTGQETLQQIGSLPSPPAMLPVLDERERFRDHRAQKSLNTISSSSEEVRAYFRKEEHLRYLIPERAFHYTALDGRKCIVAPLRRGGGKPTTKAREHFMLKPDRPPHVTVLCIVRDAAARLPGSIGTRADVCTLIRDSQFVVEDVTDAQVNQVVSGALDRLHYMRDPCVQFDGDRKLWVYLHRDREEEDFEDDGTSSTKKWKRPRNDSTDQSELGARNDSNYHTNEELQAGCSAGYDENPDNADINPW
ncbi:hypothetical protein AXF42_Ash020613 [Apostasia shenzhenica]|uniref:DEUBAD domain-containing protein n=1 Tax=Apostasia shenzhenica TaxID=1088818 RepID=A0A2I0A0I7_9ASPA|nr:hypothetical protein AXF42_Ash020613 [Apostasia shenzhenica]